MSILKQGDLFAATIRPYITRKDFEFKSYIGSITTFSVFALSISYLIWQLYEWQNNRLLPNISQQFNSVADNYNYTINLGDITISQDEFYQEEGDNHEEDPFDQDNTILVPFLIVNGDWICLNPIDQEIKFKVNVTNYDYPAIIFYNCTSANKCDNKTKCASKASIDKFYMVSNQLQMNTQLKNYDIQTNQYLPIEQINYLSVDPVNFNQLRMQLLLSTTKVGRGFIFPSYETQDYMYGISDQSISFSGQFMKNQYQSSYDKYQDEQEEGQDELSTFQPVIQITYELNYLTQQTTIQYPLLGTVLASVGAIVSILMLSQHVILFINTNRMEEYMIDEIIKYYYPEFKQYKIKKSLFGNKIRIFSAKDKKIEYDATQIQELYDRIRQQAKSKLSYMNIIYESSRMQFALQSLQERDSLSQSQNVGIRLPPMIQIQLDKHIQPSNEEERNHLPEISKSQDNILKDEDMSLFSIPEKQEETKNNAKNEFYKVNHVDIIT